MRATKILSMGVAACLALLGCNGEESATGPGAPALTDSSLVATWTTTMQASGTTVELVMEVSGDHTLIIHIKSPVQTPAGGTVMMEVQRQYVTWSLKDNVMTSEWTACETLDPGTGQFRNSACPVAKEASQVALSGKSLTVLKGEDTWVFTRD